MVGWLYSQLASEKDTLDKIRERVKSKKYNFVYGRDDTQKVGREYGAVATPAFFVLDKERTIRDVVLFPTLRPEA